MLAMAVGTDRSIGHAGLDGLPVHALHVGLRHFPVALAAGCGNIPVIDLGTRVARREDAMASVAVGATRSNLVRSRRDSAVHASPVLFDRMGEGDVVTGEKVAIAVTGSTSIRQVLLG